MAMKVSAAETTKETEKQEPIKLKITVTEDQRNRVQRILNKFIKSIGKDKSKYNLEIVESKDLNAYATLGNKIVVNTALINFLENESALAFVMAHELGHIESHHVVKKVARSGIASLIRNIFFKERSAIYKQVFDGANQFHNLYYSRSKERESDHFAVELINKHYCKEANKLEFFEKMSEKVQGGKVLEYFSTHPLPSSRLHYLQEKIAAADCVM